MAPDAPVAPQRDSGRRPLVRGSMTMWSLTALCLGVILGLVGQANDLRSVAVLAAATAPLGQLWLNALQLVVLPLVVTQMLAALTARHGLQVSLARLGARTLGLIVFFLILGALFTLLVGPPALQLFTFDAATMEAAMADVDVPDAAADAGSASRGWFSALVPSNLLQAALTGNILGVLLFTVAFGLAVTQLPAAQRDPISNLFSAAAAAMMQVVRWVLVATPVGVFALMLEMSLVLGFDALGFLVAWVVFVSAMLILFNGLLYPLTALIGRTPMRLFARAVAPGQIVALGTRSSLACLPALVEGGRTHLRLPASTLGFVLPLCVTVFKQNRTISSTAKLLFLAHAFGVSLAIGDVIIFVLTVLLLSFSAVGVPRGGAAFTTLPAYLAAGIPIQGLVVLEAVETIPDFFKTMLNTTADMSVAVIASRSDRDAAEAVAAPEPMPEYAGDVA